MLADEVKEILRELGSQIDANELEILVRKVEPRENECVRALGNERFLRVAWAAETTGDIDEELERSVRALRAAARRWGAESLPAATWPETLEAPPHSRVVERIEGYLEAMAASSRARNVLVTLYGDVVASANEALELESERVPFMLKRIDADAAEREGTSFGEIRGDDFYARSFWVGAALIVFFEGPWALDFVRHRARHVCRELAHLLAALDPPPSTPAGVAPVPE